MTIDFQWKARWWNEWADCETLHPASAVNSAQGMRLIPSYVSSWKKSLSVITSRRWSCVCWALVAAGCPAVKPTGFSPVCGRWRSSSPPSAVIKKKKRCLTLSCCFSGTYHLCSPLGYWYKSKCRRCFRMNQQFWGGGIDWILSWFHKTFRQTN